MQLESDCADNAGTHHYNTCAVMCDGHALYTTFIQVSATLNSSGYGSVGSMTNLIESRDPGLAGDGRDHRLIRPDLCDAVDRAGKSAASDGLVKGVALAHSPLRM